MNSTFISLGTNLGNRKMNIETAYIAIQNQIGKIITKSSYYETPPWGFNSDQVFVNTVILLETTLTLNTLLKQLKKIESDMGRKIKNPNLGYQDRVIDLDIIDFNGRIFNSDTITIPHERMSERNFVIFPLHEIAPNWVHPKSKKPIKTIKDGLLSNNSIIKLI